MQDGGPPDNGNDNGGNGSDSGTHPREAARWESEHCLPACWDGAGFDLRVPPAAFDVARRNTNPMKPANLVTEKDLNAS